MSGSDIVAYKVRYPDGTQDCIGGEDLWSYHRDAGLYVQHFKMKKTCEHVYVCIYLAIYNILPLPWGCCADQRTDADTNNESWFLKELWYDPSGVQKLRREKANDFASGGTVGLYSIFLCLTVGLPLKMAVNQIIVNCHWFCSSLLSGKGSWRQWKWCFSFYCHAQISHLHWLFQWILQRCCSRGNGKPRSYLAVEAATNANKKSLRFFDLFKLLEPKFSKNLLRYCIV